MMLFQKLISPGDTVIEIGGHIGFVSQYFSKLTGPTGKVIVFEPGSNNLPYIKKNTARCSNIFLETQAVSEKSGTAILYEDNISGQNNSLLADYHVADGVAQSHSLQLIKKKNHVNVTSLDDYLNDKSIIPKFIKIDIEGCELQALRGMGRVLKNVQSLMVEVSCNHDEVFKILSSEGFFIYNDLGETLLFAGPKFQGNVFALRSPLDL